jgi:ATP-dependent RNA helicase RhlB
MTDSHLSDLRFDSLPLDNSVRQGIQDAGFEYCTPIQASALPLALRGEDVAGRRRPARARPRRS